MGALIVLKNVNNALILIEISLLVVVNQDFMKKERLNVNLVNTPVLNVKMKLCVRHATVPLKEIILMNVVVKKDIMMISLLKNVNSVSPLVKPVLKQLKTVYHVSLILKEIQLHVNV